MKARQFGFAVALAVFIADQLTKWLVTGPLGVERIGDQLILLPIFNLTYTENFGISGGFLHAGTDAVRWMLIAFTSAIAVGVAYWIGREKNRHDQLALGMVLGGALGNILDRTRLGYVVDFADLHFRAWPASLCWSYDQGACRPFLVFNVSDAAISIGVAILLLRAFLTRKDPVDGVSAKETIDHA